MGGQLKVIVRSWLNYHVQQIRALDARCKNIIEQSQKTSMLSSELPEFRPTGTEAGRYPNFKVISGKANCENRFFKA